MTTSQFPVPLAGARDWRVPLARRLVLGIGWLAFAAGVGAGVTGLVMGMALAWAAPAIAAFVALASLIVVPEPRPAAAARRTRRNARLRPEPIELPSLWADRGWRHPVSVNLLESYRAEPTGPFAAYESHRRW